MFGAAAIGATMGARAISGGSMRGSSNEPRWHQITHLHDDVDEHSFEDSGDKSNFSNAAHDEMNNKRRKMHSKIAMMDSSNIPTWMIEKTIQTNAQNEENAG